ncbi:MAG: GNAT family N-acetyltransferase [Pseudomonadota bacterium]
MTVDFRIPELETERLRMRLAHRGDLEALAEFRASQRSKGVGGPYAPNTAFGYLERLVGQWYIRGYGRWIVTEKGDDTALGLVGIYDDVAWPEAEIGWTMFEAGEGKGYAFEAAKATRDYVYNTLGWTRIISSIMSDNVRSIELAKRMGCTHSGESFTVDGIGTLDIWVHPAPEAAQ